MRFPDRRGRIGQVKGLFHQPFSPDDGRHFWLPYSFRPLLKPVDATDERFVDARLSV